MALQNTSVAATGSNNHHNFTLYISEHSTSLANNTSYIGWTLQLTPKQTGWDWNRSNAMSWSVTIAGKNYSGYLNSYDGKSTVDLGSDTFNVAHNANGAKTISFSFTISSLNYSYLPGSAANSGTLVLTPTPRKAQLTEAPNIYDTSNPTIRFNNPAGSAATIGVYIEKTDGTNLVARWAPSGATSYTFNDITDTERYRFWSAVSSGYTANIRFRVRTIIGDYDDSHSLERTLTLADAAPTISATATDTNTLALSLTGGNYIIKDFNNIEYTISAAGRKGASISSYSVRCGSKTANTATGTLNNVSDGTITFTITDSRGNPAAQNITKNIINYKNLTCNLNVDTPNTEGETTLTISGNYWNGNFGIKNNALTVEYRFAEVGTDYGDDWIAATPTIDTTNNEYRAVVDIKVPQYQKAYTFQARAKDLVKVDGVNSVERTIRATPIFDWGENDFNINGTLMINNAAQDALVESGSNSVWEWRKYESGLAECWCKYRLATTVNTAWGSMFVGATPTGRISYPFTWVVRPTEIASLNAGNYAAWVFSESGGNGNNNQYSSGSYNVCRPTTGGTGTHEFSINIYCIGKWR